MGIKVAELMVPRVLVAQPTDEVAYVREIMRGQGFHAVPVIDDEDRPAGIITSNDLIDAPRDDMEVGDVMRKTPPAVEQDAPIHVAARMMREQHVHHLLVMEDGEIVGILSSLDLLRVIEDEGPA
jgi:CBS domain-containing protein